jgi:hypothetical protein
MYAREGEIKGEIKGEMTGEIKGKQIFRTPLNKGFLKG